MHSYHLSRTLAEKGVEVTVFCGSKQLSTNAEVDGLELRRLPFRLIKLPPNFVWFQAENLVRFVRALGDFDIVHSQQASGTVCAILKRKVGFPWIVTFHSSWSKTQFAMMSCSTTGWSFKDFTTYVLGYPVFQTITRLELKFSDTRVACSRALARELASDYSVKEPSIRVIPNGVDTKFFESVKKRHARSGNQVPTLFFCGRLHRVKGIDYLLEALSILRRQYPNIKLKIFGRGPLREKLENHVRAAGLSEQVQINGYATYSRLTAELAQSDIAVFPSLYEAQSIAVLEAMACSKPVVAFDLPFSREIISHGKTGLLAQPMDPQDLARSISKLLSSEDLRVKIGDNAREYVRRHHDWNVIADQYISTYHEAQDQTCHG